MREHESTVDEKNICLNPTFRADGLLSNKSAEAVIQSLIDTVHEQRKEILKLSDGLGRVLEVVNKIGVDECNNRQDSENQGRSLVQRIDDLERNLSIPNMPINMTVGDAIDINRRKISHALHQLSSKAEIATMHQLTTTLESNLAEVANQLREDLVGTDTVSSMTDSMTSLNDRMDALTRDMHNKADVSSLKLLSSDTKFLRGQVQFTKRIDECIQVLMKEGKEHSTKICYLEEESKCNRRDLMICQHDLKDCALVNGVEELKQNLRSVTEIVDQKADAALTSSNQTQIGTMKADIHAIKENLREGEKSNEISLENLDRRLDGMCLRSGFESSLGRFVEKKIFHEVLLELRNQVDEKGKDQDIKQLQSLTANLTLEHAQTKQMASLAVRFVEWYGNRDSTHTGKR